MGLATRLLESPQLRFWLRLFLLLLSSLALSLLSLGRLRSTEKEEEKEKKQLLQKRGRDAGDAAGQGWRGAAGETAWGAKERR